jgi:hypothetical protein
VKIRNCRVELLLVRPDLEPKENTMAHDQEIHFKIDKKEHSIRKDQNPVTGKFLRDLPPPVGEDYDLWLRGHGHEQDRIIKPDERIDVRDGDYFYTAKKDINPGS